MREFIFALLGLCLSALLKLPKISNGFYTKALQINEMQLGDAPAISNSLNDLANIYYATECYRRAEPLYARALEILESHSIVDDSDVKTVTNNLRNLIQQVVKKGLTGELSSHPATQKILHKALNQSTSRTDNSDARGEDLRFDLKMGFYEAIFGGEKEIRITHLETNSSNQFLQVDKVLKITIPAGVDNGTRLCVRGEGDASRRGGATGDLYIYLFVSQEDENFKRNGIDIESEIKITEEQARLGGEITVRTIDGDRQIVISPRTKNGDCLTLNGCGVLKLSSPSERGNHCIRFTVRSPIL
jgi:DnaJ-class molecular chaperone